MFLLFRLMILWLFCFIFFISFLDASPLEAFRKKPEDIDRAVIAVIGRPSIFPWQLKSFGLRLSQSSYVEFNNFDSNSYQIGGIFPIFERMIYALDIIQTKVYETPSSRQIGRTPYRQLGRPSRYSLSHQLSYPIFEGIGGHFFDLLESAQFVVSFFTQINMHYYDHLFKPWSSFGNSRDNIKSIFSSSLPPETRKIQQMKAPQGMKISDHKWDLLAGMDIFSFFSTGLFVSGAFGIGFPFGGSDNDKQNIWHARIGAGYML